MKTKNIKKALSLFLAVLMIALALPFTLLTVAAEEEAVTIKNVTFLAKKTGSSTGDVGLRGNYVIGNAYDGDLASYARSNAMSGYFASYYLDDNNSFALDTTTNPKDGGLGKYYALFVVELNETSTLKDMTLWSRKIDTTGRAHENFTNDAYDIYYSVNGTSYAAVSGASFTDMTGDNESEGANSYLYSEERKDSAGNLHYGHKIDMNNVVAKYVAIAVASPAKNSNKDAVLWEVEFGGSDIDVPVSVAGIQQGDNGAYRLVGATDSLKAEGVGFKLDITHTYEEAADSIPTSIKNVTFLAKKTGSSTGDVGLRTGNEIDKAYDGNLASYARSNTLSGYFASYYLDDNNSFALDTTTNPKDGGLGKYYALFVVELNETSTLEDMTLWSRKIDSAGRANVTFTNDAYDIYYSVNGTSYAAVSGASFTGMTGDGTNPGANTALYSQEREDSAGDLHYGHKIDMNNVVAKYVAIAVTSPSKHSNKDAVLWEVEFGGSVVADAVTVTKTATYTTEATDTVYNSILAAGENVTAKDIDASYSDAHKLYALGITGVPTNGTVELEVTPYFIPVGTDIKLYGDAATFDFIDGKATNYSETVKVMSYNICNGQVNNKTLSQRLDYIAAQINSVDPDVVVLNEARNFDAEHPTYDIAISSLTAKCDVNYGIVEYPEAESKNIVLYNTEKFTLLKSERLDLGTGTSDTDLYRRDAVIAKLKRISDNREIVAVATHISVSNYANQIGKLLDYIRDNYGDVERRIVAGDLNIQNKDIYGDGSSTGHTGRFQNPDFTDIFYTDANVSANGENVDKTITFPGDSNIIDYIYTTNFTAKNYQVLTGGQASNASDHRAIYAELTLN